MFSEILRDTDIRISLLIAALPYRPDAIHLLRFNLRTKEMILDAQDFLNEYEIQ